jgi:hypothetical protein
MEKQEANQRLSSTFVSVNATSTEPISREGIEHQLSFAGMTTQDILGFLSDLASLNRFVEPAQACERLAG